MRVREKGDHGVVQSVILFLGVSVLSGALAAGLAIPFAGLAGFGTEKTAETIQDLPQELKTEPPAQKGRILAANGDLIANIFVDNRIPIPLRRVNKIMRQAIVAIEDDRFYEHGALDAKGTLRAMLRNQSEGSVQQGGSSITQQYVKMSLVEQAKTDEERRAATEESYQRKLTELRYAVAIEKQFSKDEILEKYLNLAYFGDAAYGIQAAALHYFGVTADKLTLPQAALLAGLVKNPTGYDPTENLKRAKDRRDLVLRRMQELNVITAAQAKAAIKTPVINLRKVRDVPNGCASSKYPFYCEYVVAKALENPALGKTKKDREHYIKTAGVVIKTSLDPRIQAAAQKSIDEHSNPSDSAAAAITIIEPGTGLVKAMVQSRPYGKKRNQTAYNYNVEKSYPGGFGGFQNGSTMKAITIAAAIEKGVPLNHKINSPKQIDLTGRTYSTCEGSTKILRTYRPKNSTAASGDLTMLQAAAASTNTYFLQLSQQIGLCAIATMAKKLGMYEGQTDGEPLAEVPSMTLGVGDVTPLMLSNAYATFAARGKYCKPTIITSILDKAQKPIKTPAIDCNQAMEPAVADGVNQVLKGVMSGNGTGARLKFGDWDLAGKTGTIQENRAVWYAGYTPNLAAAAVVADANPPATNLIGQRLNGKRIRDASGSGTSGPLWQTAMREALNGMPLERFVAPDSQIVRGNVKDLPAVNGMSPEEATSVLQQAGFQVSVSVEQRNSEEAAGTVAYTDPRRRDGAPEGSVVTLYISNGQRSNTNPTAPTTPATATVPPPGGGPATTPPRRPKPNPCPPWHPKYPNCGQR